MLGNYINYYMIYYYKRFIIIRTSEIHLFYNLQVFYVKYYYILFLVFYIVLCLYIFIYRIKRIVILLSGIDLFYYLVFIIIIF